MNKRVRGSFVAITAIIMALASLGLSQTAADKATTQEPLKRVLVRAGHLLDVKTGKILDNQAILIEGDKVVSVGPAPGNQATSGAITINLPNATVLPGLIDAHTHLTGDPKNIGYPSLGISVPRHALTGAKNARLTLQAGFTTVRNVGAPGYSDVTLRDAINAGDIPGPRMLVSGPALSITGGHCDNNLLPYEYHATSDGAADGIEAVQHKVREIIKYGADLIKICATGGVLSMGEGKSRRTLMARREFAGHPRREWTRSSTRPTLTTLRLPS